MVLKGIMMYVVKESMCHMLYKVGQNRYTVYSILYTYFWPTL
jgi:hypothetical protein